MQLWLLSSGNGTCESILRKLAALDGFFMRGRRQNDKMRVDATRALQLLARGLETSRDGL